MRRRGNRDNDAFDTINAAATVIASGENRVPHVSPQKRRWRSCWSVYWCFGNHGHKKRIGHAVLSSDTSSNHNEAPAAENSIQAPAISLPFVAPPSSPASFLQSEPPSASQSPAGMVSISASMYSPSGPASIFAIGPYAHETQLVSPPAFSAFTTEPSTAPFTPPAESLHLTTPSSPEVPFAQLLDSGFRNGGGSQRYPFYNYEFQCYQLHPGSPIGQLISPSSGISGSGTSSPFPDGEFTINGPHFLEFRRGNNPPKLLNLDKLSKHEWESCQGSGSLTPDSTRPSSSRFPLDRQYSDVASHSHSDGGCQNNQFFGRRVSIDLTAEDVLRCVEQKSRSLENKTMVEKMACSNEPAEGSTTPDGKTSNGVPEATLVEVPYHQKQQSISLAPTRDANLDSNDEDAPKPSWWANVRVSEKQNGDISYGTPEKTHVDAPRHQKQDSFALAPPGDFNLDTNDEDAPNSKWWAKAHGSESQNGEISCGTPETTHVNAPRHQKQESFALAPIRDFNLDSNDEDASKLNWWANTHSSESQNGEISNGTTDTTRMNASRHQKQESFALDPIRDFNFDNDDKDAPKLIWWANRHGCESQDGENCTKTPNTTDVDMPCHQKQHSITLSPIGDFNIVNDDEDDPALRPTWWASGNVVRNDVAATKNWSFFPMIQPGVS